MISQKSEKSDFSVSDRNQGDQILFLQGAKSNMETGQKRAKGPNEDFGANKCYLGQNFLNLASKGPTWHPCLYSFRFTLLRHNRCV